MFNLEETAEVGDYEQKCIDNYEIRTILTFIEDPDMNLASKIVEITRIGRKENDKIRPVKIRFESAYYRDAAVFNGFRLKYMNNPLEKAKICKDLIRDDREKSKTEYEKRKQEKLERSRSQPDPNPDQVSPANEVNDSQGANEGIQAVPRQEEQPNLT